VKREALEVTVPNGPRLATRARQSVDALEGQAHPETLAKVRLLITEMAGAASQMDPTRDIRVRLTIEAGVVRGEVASGRAVARRPGGWALFLARRLAARWGVSQGTLWFEVDDRDRPFRRRNGR
jgi:hypothetical protein